MKFTIQSEKLLKPLQLVAGAVEKRQTMAVLSNVLLKVGTHSLTVTATDMEIELIGQVSLIGPAEKGEITVSARKLIDICRNLPDDTEIEVSYKEPYVVVKALRSKFNLAPLPAEEFPVIETTAGEAEFNIPQNNLRYLLETTSFSMGQNDVRYYLNGLSMQVTSDGIRAVATDGHRLATSSIKTAKNNKLYNVIIPRKGVVELLKLLSDVDDEVTVTLMSNHIKVVAGNFTFTSKLIDASYPDYNKVIPLGGDKEVIINRDIFKNALTRVSILSNEKFRGVRFVLNDGRLLIDANNPNQEEAEEVIELKYDQEDFSIGFNVSYMLDALSNVPEGDVKLTFKDSDSSIMLETLSDSRVLYVIMPMRL